MPKSVDTDRKLDFENNDMGYKGGLGAYSEDKAKGLVVSAC